MKKETRNTIIKILISAILLTIIFLNVDRHALVANFKLLDSRYIPLIFFLFIANYVISSIRWKLLLVHKDSEEASVSYLTSLYFVGSS